MDFGNAGFRGDGTPGSGRRRRSQNFRDTRNFTKRVLLAGEGGDSELYPAALNLYPVPPTQDISLEMFEDLAVQRLRVLRIIEKQNLSGKTKFSSDWQEAIRKDLNEAKPTPLASFFQLCPRAEGKKVIEWEKHRMLDHISHFIARLAYCRTEELRRWFVTHESDLFRFRWGCIKEDFAEEIQTFLRTCGLNYEAISEEEKENKREKLIAAAGYGISAIKFEEEKYYKVSWLEAIDLVRSRRVFIEAGMAYIPSSEVLSLVIGVFRSKLSHNLVLTCRALPVLEDDARLVSMVQNLDKRYTGEDYSANKTAGRVLPTEVEGLSKRNFPLCMSTIQQVLTSSHHIKYKARLQYGLFLKGIGMTLEDAMKFFRGEFTKRHDVDVDKFEKEYAYGIRYNYGKEGKKKNWQPWDCMRIIMENIGPGENHGCPFRHQENKTVRQRVESYGLKKDEVEAVMKKLEEGHYQIACGLHFSAVHLKELTTGAVSHPNQWYLESRGEVGGGAVKSSSNKNIKTVRASVYSQSQASQESTQDTQAEDQSQLEMMDDGEFLEALESSAST